MSSSTSHTSPSAYALEKAVRVAARNLGRTASTAEIEQEALTILAADGYIADVRATTTPVSETPLRSARVDAAATLHLSVSVAGCTSRRLSTQRARMYDQLRKVLLCVPDSLRGGTHLHIRDTSSLLVGHDPDAVLVLAEVLHEVGSDIPASRFYGPFIDAALPENLSLLERLPELLSVSPLLCPTIQIGTRDNGLPGTTLEALCYALAALRPNPAAEHPLIVSVNDCDRRAFGYRVHPDTRVVHLRIEPSHQGDWIEGLDRDWMRVSSADLPLSPDAMPGRTTDHIVRLPHGDPSAVRRLLDDLVIPGLTSGARRQLLVLC